MTNPPLADRGVQRNRYKFSLLHTHLWDFLWRVRFPPTDGDERSLCFPKGRKFRLKEMPTYSLRKRALAMSKQYNQSGLKKVRVRFICHPPIHQAPGQPGKAQTLTRRLPHPNKAELCASNIVGMPSIWTNANHRESCSRAAEELYQFSISNKVRSSLQGCSCQVAHNCFAAWKSRVTGKATYRCPGLPSAVPSVRKCTEKPQPSCLKSKHFSAQRI